MIEFEVGGEKMVIPTIVAAGATEDTRTVFVVTDGEYEGVEFTISNFSIDDDEGTVSYDCSIVRDNEKQDLSEFRSITDPFIIYMIEHGVDSLLKSGHYSLYKW